MKNRAFLVASLLFACAAATAANPIEIDLGRSGCVVPESLYGIFFEEINHAGDGGLYAEMVRNRGFEDAVVPEGYRLEEGKLYPPALPNHLTGGLPQNMQLRWNADPIPGWSFARAEGTGASVGLTCERPLDTATPTALRIDLPRKGRTTVTNAGYWGMHVEKGKKYRLVLHTSGAFDGKVTVRITSKDGRELCSRKFTPGRDARWTRHTATLSAAGSASGAKLVIEPEGQGTLLLDYVSLVPAQTYRNRENGLRTDIAATLEALRPAFVRWPGGGIVEGITVSNRVRWKETIGNPLRRPGQYNLWGYRSTYGFGYHEFLQFCEDIGAEALFVCNAGLGGQAAVGDACPEEELEQFIGDALDAIDYALGDGTCEWSRRRIENGHSGPFPLKYIEVGNENWGPVYEKRYDKFYKAIKASYPELTIISTLGFGEQHRHEQVDLIDPHIYSSAEYFFGASSMFDHMERGEYGIYIGEYAVTQGVGHGNLYGALAEAAFLTGAERNADLVRMTSYAPLLSNVHDRAWSPTLIEHDAGRVAGRTSYYVQRLFAENRPTYNLTAQFGRPGAEISTRGRIALGGWNTDNEYKELRVTLPDGRVVEADMAQDWTPQQGAWSAEGGVMRSTGEGGVRRILWNTAEVFGDCTIELKARKIAGDEGFAIYFGLHDGMQGYLLNIGGWGNRSTAFQHVQGDHTPHIANYIAQTIETGRWYDIRIDIRGGEFVYRLDGEKMLEVHTDNARHFLATGYDEPAGELVVKLVNATAEPFTTSVRLQNATAVEPRGKAIVLGSTGPTDENSLDDPHRIIPCETVFDGFGDTFDYTFRPWSLTVLRIKTAPKTD